MHAYMHGRIGHMAHLGQAWNGLATSIWQAQLVGLAAGREHGWLGQLPLFQSGHGLFLWLHLPLTLTWCFT